MTQEEELFTTIGQKISGTEQSQLFGKPCIKINRKAFLAFFQNEMVFKLSGDVHEKALKLEGAKLFDPSGKDHPMKEWVQVPYQHNKDWSKFAKAAAKLVTEK